MNVGSITVNGSERPWVPELTIAALIEHEVGSGKGVAVAIGRVVVPRSAWTTTSIEPGAMIEIVTAAAGG